MALTEAQYRTMIASDFGQQSDDGFTQQVDLKWQMVEDEVRPRSLYLHYLHTKAEMLDYLLGGAYQRYTWSEKGVSESEGQVFDHLTEMQKSVSDKIAEAKRRQRSGQVVGGRMTATTPQPESSLRPRPSDPAYKGDPGKRFPGPRGAGYDEGGGCL